MRVLGLETSGPAGSVCLSAGETVLAEHSLGEGMVHGRELVPALDRVLRQAGVAPESVQLIAVSLGPGSFTGLRVGLAVAKTLAFAAGLELVGVPTLEVLVRNVPEDASWACPMTDARRGEINAMPFQNVQGVWKAQAEYRTWRPAELVEFLPQGTSVLGEACRVYAVAFECRRDLVRLPEACWAPQARWVARLGYQRYLRGQRDDPHTLVPLYLRLPPVVEKLG